MEACGLTSVKNKTNLSKVQRNKHFGGLKKVEK